MRLRPWVHPVKPATPQSNRDSRRQETACDTSPRLSDCNGLCRNDGCGMCRESDAADAGTDVRRSGARSASSISTTCRAHTGGLTLGAEGPKGIHGGRTVRTKDARGTQRREAAGGRLLRLRPVCAAGRGPDGAPAKRAWLRRWATTRAGIEGHCDSRGTSEYNLALGERRAEAVRTYLISLGIVPDRLVVVSKGEEAPVCREKSEACWQQNRRGHFIITAK